MNLWHERQSGMFSLLHHKVTTNSSIFLYFTALEAVFKTFARLIAGSRMNTIYYKCVPDGCRVLGLNNGAESKFNENKLEIYTITYSNLRYRMHIKSSLTFIIYFNLTHKMRSRCTTTYLCANHT